MKIALINGSPKTKSSASGCILQELKPLLGLGGNTINEYNFNKPHLSIDQIEQVAKFDTLVFAFPLYVDGIPSHLLNCLIQLEELFKDQNEKNITVYSIVNCGFYEGHQCKNAIEIMENWCERAGLKWGQGVGIGAGGMIQSVKNVPLGYGPKKNLGTVFNQLVNNILNRTSGENIFITANFPRIMYKIAAEMGWRKAIKANGLRRKDLHLRK